MNAKTRFRGSFTALVTPFKDGELDESAFRGLVQWQVAEGTAGLVPVGTTGESPTLSHDEHNLVVEWCVEQANGRVPADTRVTILPRSVLGLKYVELERGSGRRLVADGGTLPISQTSVPVQFDDIFKTFDRRTRGAIQQNLAGYGDVLAARGSALNDTIHSLVPLLGHLRPVAAVRRLATACSAPAPPRRSRSRRRAPAAGNAQIHVQAHVRRSWMPSPDPRALIPAPLIPINPDH